MKSLVMRLAYWLMHLYWRLFRPVTLGVRIILLNDDGVVLVRHRYQPGWHFPGGAVNRNETIADAAKREAYEESGATVTGEMVLMGIYSTFAGGKSDHVATYVAHDFRLGRAKDRWEIAECRVFALDDLPDDLTHGTRVRLEEYLRMAGRMAEMPRRGR